MVAHHDHCAPIPMNKIMPGLLFAALSLPAAACQDHPWYRPAPAGLEAEHVSVLYQEASPEMRKEAARLLEGKLVRAISPAQAAQLTGEDERSWVPGMTYLLRGVRYDNPESHYGVVYDEAGDVVVYFGMKGKAEHGPYAAPMVAVLPQPPAALYVTCTLMP